MLKPIVVTGGAGFIGSCMVWKLNTMGYNKIIIVDEFDNSPKWKNLKGLKFTDIIDKDTFLEKQLATIADTVFHFGAICDTTEKNMGELIKKNFEYSKNLFTQCITNKTRFIYASSAATYGDGNNGFSDNEEDLHKLNPLNMYAFSKNIFDLWMYNNKFLNASVGLKFFNVFGPNEYHKGNMSSFVYQTVSTYKNSNFKIKLFESNDLSIEDGNQKRDFIYVKDAVELASWFMKNKNKNGIYNIGSGIATTWNELANYIILGLGANLQIEYVPMPNELQGSYQNFTKAEMSKLSNVGCNISQQKIQDSVKEYIQSYILTNQTITGFKL